MNRVYFIRYGHYHVDQNPALYVLYSDPSDTYGLNIHYLPQIFSKQWKYRWINLIATIDMLRRYRRHPALKLFFEYLEMGSIDRMNWKSKISFLSKRWPRFIKSTFRHYKTPYIQIIQSLSEKQVAALTAPAPRDL